MPGQVRGPMHVSRRRHLPFAAAPDLWLFIERDMAPAPSGTSMTTATLIIDANAIHRIARPARSRAELRFLHVKLYRLHEGVLREFPRERISKKLEPNAKA